MITTKQVRIEFPRYAQHCSDKEIERAIGEAWDDVSLVDCLRYYAEINLEQIEKEENWAAEEQARHDCEYE